jgi:hypothetical protein
MTGGLLQCARRFFQPRRPPFCFHSSMLMVPALRADVVPAFILVLTEDVSLIEVQS